MATSVINPIKKAGAGVDWALPAAAVAMVFVMLNTGCIRAVLIDMYAAQHTIRNRLGTSGKWSITKTMATAAAGRANPRQRRPS